ncbi:MAG: GDSL-type esterase/lipase family protein [Bacteriovoracaceae bacterium]
MKLNFIILILIFSFSSVKAEEFTMASIGDSVSRAYNAKSFFSNDKLNWSSGSGPRKNKGEEEFSSHYIKIQKMFPEKKVNAINVAIAGSTTRSLKKQIRRLLRKDKKIDYATILTGVNNLCRIRRNHDEKINKMKVEMKNAVQTLINHNPKVKIVMVPIPNMESLFEAMRDKRKCRRIWNFVPLCKQYLRKKVSEEKRDAFLARVEQANKGLEEVAKEFEDNVFFNLHLSFIEFGEESISNLDCFHPNTQGQSLISEYTWNPEFILGRELRPDEDFY